MDFSLLHNVILARRWRGRAVALLCGGLLTGAAMACPSQLPPTLLGSTVGEQVRINGLRMAIRQVQGKASVEELMSQTEKQWKGEGFTAKRSSAAGWQVLTSLSEKCLATLQLSKRDGAFGYFARSTKDPAPRAELVARAPVPPGATVTSSVSSLDDGRRGLVLSMTSSSSMHELNKFFIDELVQAKWSVPRSHTVKNKASGATALFMTAQRQREQIDIVLWPQGPTQIVMTIAEAL